MCVLDMAKYRIDEGQWQEAGGPEDRSGGAGPVRPGASRRGDGPAVVQPEVLAAAAGQRAGHDGLCVPCGGGPGRAGRAVHRAPGALHDQPQRPADRLRAGRLVDRSGHHESRRCPRTPCVKGDNSLELQMAFSEDKNIEAVYLIGKFGVRIEGHRQRADASCRRSWRLAMSRPGPAVLLGRDPLQGPAGTGPTGRRACLHRIARLRGRLCQGLLRGPRPAHDRLAAL